MKDDELFPPGGGSVLILVVFVALIVFLVGWVVLWLFLKQHGALELAPVAQTDRERWIGRLRSVSGEDLRALHLGLARTMRSILSERSGRDVSSWTVGDIAAHPDLVSVSRLLEQWEEPSFAPESDADAAASIEGAVREVERW